MEIQEKLLLAEQHGLNIDDIETLVLNGKIHANDLDFLERGAPGFMIYDDLAEQLELLSDEEAGRVIKSGIHYKLTGETSALSAIEAIVFYSLQKSIDKNQKKYTQRCVSNFKNIVKRWAKK